VSDDADLLHETEIRAVRVSPESEISLVVVPASTRRETTRARWARIRAALAGIRNPRPPADPDEPPSIR